MTLTITSQALNNRLKVATKELFTIDGCLELQYSGAGLGNHSSPMPTRYVEPRTCSGPIFLAS